MVSTIDEWDSDTALFVGNFLLYEALIRESGVVGALFPAVLGVLTSLTADISDVGIVIVEIKRE